jgi:hypothetical protein
MLTKTTVMPLAEALARALDAAARRTRRVATSNMQLGAFHASRPTHPDHHTAIVCAHAFHYTAWVRDNSFNMHCTDHECVFLGMPGHRSPA